MPVVHMESVIFRSIADVTKEEWLEGLGLTEAEIPDAVIVEGSSQAEDTGQPVAYLGCKTQCGPFTGQITTGSPTAKVEP